MMPNTVPGNIFENQAVDHPAEKGPRGLQAVEDGREILAQRDRE